MEVVKIDSRLMMKMCSACEKYLVITGSQLLYPQMDFLQS